MQTATPSGATDRPSPDLHRPQDRYDARAYGGHVRTRVSISAFHVPGRTAPRSVRSWHAQADFDQRAARPECDRQKRQSDGRVADAAKRLSFNDLFDQYRARPVPGDRSRDRRLAVVEEASDDFAFDQDILAFVAKQFV